MAEQYAIEMRGITKAFGSVVANHNVELKVRQGEILALLGENGSGKTTLMNMLGCLDTPTSGTYFLNGQDVSTLTDDELKQFQDAVAPMYDSFLNDEQKAIVERVKALA